MMSSITNTYSSSKLNILLKKYRVEKGSEHTNTRIGDKSLSIYGGIYNINYNDEFWSEYYKEVIVNNENEYLTEKQLIENGPLLIDVDFRYNKDVVTRMHTKSHIIDLIDLYASKLNDIYNVSSDTTIDIFILEKPNINILEDKVKDGIHIIFGLKMHKAEQIILRKKILNDINLLNSWNELPLTNSFEDVFDEGVTKGQVNWQLFGSKKPNNEAYKMSYYYKITYKTSESIWEFNDIKLNDINLRELLPKLSARYSEHIRLDLNDNEFLLDAINEEKSNLNRKNNTNRKLDNINFNEDFDLIDFSKISTKEQLDYLINKYIDDDSIENYDLKETYLFTMILPEKYYKEGSFNNWIRVGWALRNYDEKSLSSVNKSDKKSFLIWLKFSSQVDNFDFRDINELYSKWSSFDNNNPDGLTKRSILYWAKSDNNSEYQKIREKTITFYIEKTLESMILKDKVGEFDLANVLYQIAKDKFVCTDIKKDIWYEFKNNRWQMSESGNTLRLIISRKMHDIYMKKAQSLISVITQMENNDQKADNLKIQATKLGDICMYLKTTSWKSNIMKEARDLFYDNKFIEKLDSNPYLLGFNNYVVDFKNKLHRKGRADDFISKTTNIDYIPYKKLKGPCNHNKDISYESVIDEINKFINELFPNIELRQYMWEHFASLLLGTTENQTFNIYTGSGCNGKSKLVELLSKCLGEYKATVPVTLITQKRNSIGSTSSEIVQLQGIRYAVMQEPSKGDEINEGILKEITGGDPIQARGLYKESITFIPQFKLVVCTNTLFDIKSNDDGTWRRIRVCDFASKFVDSPYGDDNKFPRANFPHQYEIDRKIDEKFITWAPVFMSILCNITFNTQGIVKDVKSVLSISDKYREGQDYLAEFIKDKVVKKFDSKIKKTEILEEFKKWYISNCGKTNNIPKGKEITDCMDRLFGKCNRGKWLNVELIYDNCDYDDDDDSE